jgi:hypothetical protein
VLREARETEVLPQHGTIFEDSPIALEKWLPVMWMLVNAKNGISSWEIRPAVGVTQKTAWFMLQRACLAMQDDLSGGMLGGEVEIDETYIGGKARNMHKERKVRYQNDGRNTGGKTVVMGMLQRGGKVVASVIPDQSKAIMQPIIRGSVAPGTQIHSDEWADHYRMDEYTHNVLNHVAQYVDGNVHCKGMDKFWSLLKRTVGGTYASVETFHLFRYVDEQAFCFNNRGPMNDGDCFVYAMRKIVGKRLTYAELTGKTEQGQEETQPI